MSQTGPQLAIVTCMDARIDPLAVLGASLGEAQVIRNAGARLTDDVLRSLALSAHVFGIESVVVLQHTDCGLAKASEEELRARTGADVEFHAIADHSVALREDVDRLAGTAYLQPLRRIEGALYNLDTQAVEQVVLVERDR